MRCHKQTTSSLSLSSTCRFNLSITIATINKISKQESGVAFQATRAHNESSDSNKTLTSQFPPQHPSQHRSTTVAGRQDRRTSNQASTGIGFSLDLITHLHHHQLHYTCHVAAYISVVKLKAKAQQEGRHRSRGIKKSRKSSGALLLFRLSDAPSSPSPGGSSHVCASTR